MSDMFDNSSESENEFDGNDDTEDVPTDQPQKTTDSDDEKTEQQGDKQQQVDNSTEKDNEDEAGEPQKSSNNIANLGLNDSDDEDDEGIFDGDDEVVGRDRSELELMEEKQKEQQRLDAQKDSVDQKFLGLDSDDDDEVLNEKKPTVSVKKNIKFSILNIPPPTTSGETEKSRKNLNKNSIHMVKLPNIVNINPEPYDKMMYDAEEEEKEYKGKIHNMIRWRYKKDVLGKDIMRNPDTNQLLRESNARVVAWSDGSFTLHVGSEAFEIDENVNPMMKKTPTKQMFNKNSSSATDGYLYLSQYSDITESITTVDESKTNSDDNSTSNNNGEVTEINKSKNTVLECMGAVKSRLTIKPSIKSEAHKQLTLSVRQKNTKKAKITEVVTQVDPEKEKNEKYKNKEELKRSTNYTRRSFGRRRATGGNKYYRDLDDQDTRYDSFSIDKMKRKVETGSGYYDEEEDDEDNWMASKRRRPSKSRDDYDDDSDDDLDTRKKTKRGDSDDSDDNLAIGDGDGDSDDDSDEDFNLNRRKQKEKTTAKSMFDDDDDDDSD